VLTNTFSIFASLFFTFFPKIFRQDRFAKSGSSSFAMQRVT